MLQLIKNLIKKLPFIRTLVREQRRLSSELESLNGINDQLRQELAQLSGVKNECFLLSEKIDGLQSENDLLNKECFQLGLEVDSVKVENRQLQEKLEKISLFVPPGHYYSPIPSIDEIKRDEARIFTRTSRFVPSVDLKVNDQELLLNEFKQYYKEVPFTDDKTERLRYYFKNSAYSYGDAIFLFCMLRHLNPKRIIEIGSGYSSSVILDTNEFFFGDSISCTFIEPYTQTLESLLKEEDRTKIQIISTRVQDVDMELFSSLTLNDVLFIDSTHISKINSDVNFILFSILPILQKGVYVHFHDIFYPFEYPKEWVYEGIAWNEGYLLRAFLQYNTTFKIVFWSEFIGRFYRDFLINEMPLAMQNPGAQLWISKTTD
jgi:hypothetical protein